MTKLIIEKTKRNARYEIMRLFLTLVVIGFVALCGVFVVQTGLFEIGSAGRQAPCILLQQTTGGENNQIIIPPDSKNTSLQAVDAVTLGADNAEDKTIILGAQDPCTEDPEFGFKFQLELSSKGAAIRKATFSNGNGNGFDDRDYKNPKPLVILSPVGGQPSSMANKELIFVEQKLQLRLSELHWKSYEVEHSSDGSQTARFEAVIKTSAGEPVIKLVKTYRIVPGSYLLDCDLTVENLSDSLQKVRFNLAGPKGLGREGFRTDMRKAMACYRDSEGQINSNSKQKVKFNAKTLRNSNGLYSRPLPKPEDNFLWAAATNKYFAAIVVPSPDEGKDYCDWITDKVGFLYNPDRDERADSGDETIGVDLQIASREFSAAGQADSSKTYNFRLYLGPKDKSLFDKDQMYRDLGFMYTIDFMICCCPAAIIRPLAFMILAFMKWMYGFIGNYGVVIIILVFMFRIVIHPLTKKSQVSMRRMSKLAPKAEEIKKKYANNKTEMNKQIMALYREQGASPVMGFLPMMVQMPVWIALWSAIYTSIDLRGEPFLPFWITDLSVPDAFFRFPSPIIIPLLNWKILSLNLLPILMGVAMYLQQKMMPKQAATNPQAAQQQKMMMIMMPLFLPLVLYNGPSGVNMYIMSSTFAGVIEQYFIRKHINEKEETESQGLVAVTRKTGGKVKKKKPKPFYKQF
ncbi:MAG: YidC/Oxa1 family insertase periplasmic-domain containing protein [Planctomycetota bacterium]|jgi:YidC/Oxa1 family membrane protein insertase